MSQIENSIRTVLGDSFPDIDNETRSKFLKRLAKTAITTLSEDDTQNQLGEREQDWLKLAGVSIKNKKAIKEFPDADEDDIAARFPAEEKKTKKEKIEKLESPSDDANDDSAEEELNGEISEEETPTPKKKSKKGGKKSSKKVVKKTTKRSSKKVTKPAKEKKEKGPRKPREQRTATNTYILSKWIVDNLDGTFAELWAYAQKKELSTSESTAGALYHYARGALNILKAEKRIKMPKKA